MAILLALTSLGARPEDAATKPKALKPEPIPILPAQEVWTAQLEAPPAANACMDDERVYVGLQGRGIRAFSRDTGDPVWTEAVDITHSPLAIDDHLLIAMPEEIRALAPRTGQVRWSHRLARPLTAALSAEDGLALLADDHGTLTAIRVQDGAEVWRQALGAVSRHVPARIPPTTIVLTLADGRVVALDARTGARIWERSLPGILSAPAAARDRVLVGSTNNRFYALDPESGDEHWHWRTGADVIGAAAAGERVYFVSLDNVLRAVNRDNGNQLWKAAIPSRASAPPVAFDDVVVLAGVAPRVDVYNARTGAALGTFTALTDLEGVPLIDTTPTPFKVAIVALTRDGLLTALRPTGLMFPDPPLTPLLKLPGRELAPDRIPRTPGPQLPTPR